MLQSYSYSPTGENNVSRLVFSPRLTEQENLRRHSVSATFALTGVVGGHGDRQWVAHASVQVVGAHCHHLDHVAGVGQQVVQYRPLVDREGMATGSNIRQVRWR